jgi:catechol 2,3-dioxygenase
MSQSAEATRAQSVSWAAPIRIGKVTLTVRDLAKVRDYYNQVIGLAVIDEDKTSARLGAGGNVFLELQQDANAALNSQREAGLFHTAFLLPTRKDLASWINHVAKNRMPIQGASDHIVSEALYLADPEGNGIEVYVDKPASGWDWSSGSVKMATERLDIEGLLAAGDNGVWKGAPDATFVGHIHLQVGNLAETEKFYGDVLGFDLVTNYPGAKFWSTGKYHHHIGSNIWNSRGAGQRSAGRTGLKSFELVSTSPSAKEALLARLDKAGHSKARRIADPWGTVIELAAA